MPVTVASRTTSSTEVISLSRPEPKRKRQTVDASQGQKKQCGWLSHEIAQSRIHIVGGRRNRPLVRQRDREHEGEQQGGDGRNEPIARRRRRRRQASVPAGKPNDRSRQWNAHHGASER